jgi:hypothetical protein
LTGSPELRGDPSEVPYEIVELTDAPTTVPGRVGSTEGLVALLHPNDVPLDRVRDPLFQAFVATGFFRPC